MKVLIRNGKVCFENAIEAADILVANGKVAALGPFHDAIRSARIIDAKGLFAQWSVLMPKLEKKAGSRTAT